MQTSLIELSKKNKLNINIIFFSILLLPVSLFAGPAVTEILIFMIYHLLTVKSNYPKSYYLYATYAFFL